MKEKLMNLFLDVQRFSVLTLSDKLIHDIFYSKLLTDVLFGYLRNMRKQAWVKTPQLSTVIRDVREAVQLSQEASSLSGLLRNCEKLCLTLPVIPQMPAALDPSDQLVFPNITRLELTPLVLNAPSVATVKLLIGSCPNLVHFKLHVLQYGEDSKLYHMNVILDDLFHKCFKVKSLVLKAQWYNMLKRGVGQAGEKVHDQLFTTPLFFNH